MFKIKTEDICEDFRSDKEMFDFSTYSAKSKYYNNQKKLVADKMKVETRSIAIEQFLGIKAKMYSFLVQNSEQKKAKDVNKNVVATTGHNEYKDVLLNNKCIRHSINRIQSKDHRKGTYEISKISLSCFDDKIHIQNNGYEHIPKNICQKILKKKKPYKDLIWFKIFLV